MKIGNSKKRVLECFPGFGLSDSEFHYKFLGSYSGVIVGEDKLMEELEVLKTKIDDLGKSTIEAIRKQKITSAANRVMNCFSDLRDATEVRPLLSTIHLSSSD